MTGGHRWIVWKRQDSLIDIPTYIIQQSRFCSIWQNVITSFEYHLSQSDNTLYRHAFINLVLHTHSSIYKNILMTFCEEKGSLNMNVLMKAYKFNLLLFFFKNLIKNFFTIWCSMFMSSKINIIYDSVVAGAVGQVFIILQPSSH